MFGPQWEKLWEDGRNCIRRSFISLYSVPNLIRKIKSRIERDDAYSTHMRGQKYLYNVGRKN
jgi:hypothetical protein